MPLKTVEVAQREGRVCYVTWEGDNKNVTIECAIEKVAYRLRWGQDPVQPGDWVTFRGKSRREIVSRKDEAERLLDIPYYHTPYDGSSQSEWTYIDVLEPEGLKKVGPFEKIEALKAARDALDAHIRDWYEQRDMMKVGHDVDALSVAYDVLTEKLTEVMRTSGEASAKVVAVDLKV